MKIYVIGGGAAGMLAAISAKETNPDAEVHLLEKNDKLGKKIFITGKGRGNMTNAQSIEEFFKNYVNNPRFLYSALYDFTNQDIIDLLENNGCRTKTERGDRVFPVSDHAYSITDALKHYLKKLGVEIHYKTEVKRLVIQNERVRGVETSHGRFPADRIIVATGGLAYPSTGSTGDGYRFAKDAGMNVTETYPSLVCLNVHEPDIYKLKGLSLKNISIDVTDEDGKSYYRDFGELDFIEEGLRGPVIISASAVITKYLNAYDHSKRKILTVHIDLKPALDDSQLDERLLRDFHEFRNKELRNAFTNLLPSRIISVFTERLEAKGVDINKKVTEVDKNSRKQILTLIRNFDFTLSGTGSFKEAIVTQGGVSVKDISPKTMESKKISGLYFAGEVLDVDGFTGGFNMQMAFSTGHLAGYSAAVSK
ncbi:NAD(P)/FAD-dependent oxidoreductase [Oribacterium sp. P6A1]|uniref:NAD(P)/FAD-dependent oxidoreductase n=1 Tax=Oribacterium sp. P6A1 TaxID=1410612 RepID=UPI00055C7784|nr:NAD(P)/FAD-dependent oxidoreductase [Oribacterium sp. P6A1]